MANNRLFIRCMRCGKRICIGKSFMLGYYVPPMEKPLSEVLDDFYDEHAYCKGELVEDYTDGLYELVYAIAESDLVKEL